MDINNYVISVKCMKNLCWSFLKAILMDCIYYRQHNSCFGLPVANTLYNSRTFP